MPEYYLYIMLVPAGVASIPLFRITDQPSFAPGFFTINA